MKCEVVDMGTDVHCPKEAIAPIRFEDGCEVWLCEDHILDYKAAGA